MLISGDRLILAQNMNFSNFISDFSMLLLSLAVSVHIFTSDYHKMIDRNNSGKHVLLYTDSTTV